MSARDKLVAATKALLWEHGYDAVSPREIQEQSGVGQGSFYHHFRSKEGLAAHALGEVSAEMQQALTVFFDPNQAPMERIKAYLQHPATHCAVAGWASWRRNRP
ncbi:TetR/AcrR family transcriptional regulator [Paenibacillus sp. P26]|nr:TetR/AcrR family transcriptional regulator [Paenibacillus sp. P26]